MTYRSTSSSGIHVAGRPLAFTGQLATMTPAFAREEARRVGAVLLPVSGDRVPDNALVVAGARRWPMGFGSAPALIPRPTKRLSRALYLRSRGRPVDVISEYAFLDMIGRPVIVGGGRFSPAEAAAHAGMSTSQLTRCEELGLVARGSDGRYALQDIQSLKQIASWTNAGVRVRAVARQLRRLRGIIPDTQGPLRVVDLFALPGGEIGTELAEMALLGDGQLLLRFPESADAPAPVELGARSSWRSLFESAVSLYDQGRLEEASRVMEAAAERAPDRAGVFYNLACIKLELGERGRAEQLFTLVLSMNPRHPSARYNLACSLQSKGRLAESVDLLRAGVALDPWCPDFRHLLAICLEGLARPAEAAEEWERYSTLDPFSRWGFEAARRAGDLRAHLDAQRSDVEACNAASKGPHAVHSPDGAPRRGVGGLGSISENSR